MSIERCPGRGSGCVGCLFIIPLYTFLLVEFLSMCLQLTASTHPHAPTPPHVQACICKVNQLLKILLWIIQPSPLGTIFPARRNSKNVNLICEFCLSMLYQIPQTYNNLFGGIDTTFKSPKLCYGLLNNQEPVIWWHSQTVSLRLSLKDRGIKLNQTCLESSLKTWSWEINTNQNLAFFQALVKCVLTSCEV